MTHRHHTPRLLLLSIPLVWGCSDTTAPVLPDEPATVMVDASAGWAYLSLTPEGPVPVTVADPRTSGAWDMAVFATSVMLNGGDAGPGGVDGYCVCNGGATDADVVAMTPERGLERFEEVTRAALPSAATAWVSDALIPALDGWWSYDSSTRRVSANPTVNWVVRTVGGRWAKIRIVRLEGSTQSHAGRVTLEVALQTQAGGPLAATRTITLDASGGPVTLDLESEATGGARWDLRLEGYTLRVNGGVTGSGGTGVVRTNQAWEAITDPSSIPASVFRGDTFGGVFNGAPATRWFRYNLQGNNQIWPTYHVYLVRRGSVVHRVQIIDYYGADGRSRQVTVRSAPLES